MKKKDAFINLTPFAAVTLILEHEVEVPEVEEALVDAWQTNAEGSPDPLECSTNTPKRKDSHGYDTIYFKCFSMVHGSFHYLDLVPTVLDNLGGTVGVCFRATSFYIGKLMLKLLHCMQMQSLHLRKLNSVRWNNIR